METLRQGWARNTEMRKRNKGEYSWPTTWMKWRQFDYSSWGESQHEVKTVVVTYYIETVAQQWISAFQKNRTISFRNHLIWRLEAQFLSDMHHLLTATVTAAAAAQTWIWRTRSHHVFRLHDFIWVHIMSHLSLVGEGEAPLWVALFLCLVLNISPQTWVLLHWTYLLLVYWWLSLDYKTHIFGDSVQLCFISCLSTRCTFSLHWCWLIHEELTVPPLVMTLAGFCHSWSWRAVSISQYPSANSATNNNLTQELGKKNICFVSICYFVRL